MRFISEIVAARCVRKAECKRWRRAACASPSAKKVVGAESCVDSKKLSCVLVRPEELRAQLSESKKQSCVLVRPEELRAQLSESKKPSCVLVRPEELRAQLSTKPKYSMQCP